MQAVMGLIYNFTYTLCVRGVVVNMMGPLVEIWPKEGFLCVLPYVLLYHGGCALTVLDAVISYNRLTGPFGNGYVWGSDEPENVPWMKSAINTVCIIFVCSVMSLINNSLTVLKLIKQRKLSDSTYIGDFDKKLFVYSLLIFLGHIFSLIIQLLFFLDVDEVFSYQLFYAQIFATDFVSLGPAWCLLFMSTELQKQTAILFGFYRFTGNDRVSATENTSPSFVVVRQHQPNNSKHCKNHSTAY
uniref:Serpentine receptor class gamma n=1 Tax=Panagrellus redivivus TaxID=6233 RepID=A0A7E4V4Z6_PANRE